MHRWLSAGTRERGREDPGMGGRRWAVLIDSVPRGVRGGTCTKWSF